MHTPDDIEENIRLHTYVYQTLLRFDTYAQIFITVLVASAVIITNLKLVFSDSWTVYDTLENLNNFILAVVVGTYKMLNLPLKISEYNHYIQRLHLQHTETPEWVITNLPVQGIVTQYAIRKYQKRDRHRARSLEG